MIIPEIKKMSTLELLQAMEELWDALCHEDHEIESPAWHEEVLDKRKKKIESGYEEFISIEELKTKTRQLM